MFSEIINSNSYNLYILLNFYDRLFTKGISLVGKDYFCHVLWDKYMSFELSQEQWGFLALVYVQALRFPTKKLHKYYVKYVLLTFFILILRVHLGFNFYFELRRNTLMAPLSCPQQRNRPPNRPIYLVDTSSCFSVCLMQTCA